MKLERDALFNASTKFEAKTLIDALGYNVSFKAKEVKVAGELKAKNMKANKVNPSSNEGSFTFEGVITLSGTTAVDGKLESEPAKPCHIARPSIQRLAQRNHLRTQSTRKTPRVGRPSQG